MRPDLRKRTAGYRLLFAAALLACHCRPVGQRPPTPSGSATGPQGVTAVSCDVRALEVIGHATARFSASFLFLVVTPQAPPAEGEACWPVGERVSMTLYEPWDVLDLLGARQAAPDERGPFTVAETRVLRVKPGNPGTLTNPDGRAASFPGGLVPVR